MEKIIFLKQLKRYSSEIFYLINKQCYIEENRMLKSYKSLFIGADSKMKKYVNFYEEVIFSRASHSLMAKVITFFIHEPVLAPGHGCFIKLTLLGLKHIDVGKRVRDVNKLDLREEQIMRIISESVKTLKELIVLDEFILKYLPTELNLETFNADIHFNLD